MIKFNEIFFIYKIFYLLIILMHSLWNWFNKVLKQNSQSLPTNISIQNCRFSGSIGGINSKKLLIKIIDSCSLNLYESP